jgi:ABC-2 type transport system permease protein
LSIRRDLELLYLDLWDALRPPGFDIMLLVVAAMGGALSVLQPTSSPVAALGPGFTFSPELLALFVTTIYIAIRSSSDLVNVVQGGIMQVYMSYPISRRAVAAVLYITRSLLPAAMLLGVPAVVTAIMLYPVVLRGPAQYAAMWASYLVQSQLYGTLFLLLSSRFRSTGTAIIASISFYFGYVALSGMLYLMGLLDNMQSLVNASNSMGFYFDVYYGLTGQAVSAWQYLVVPLSYAVLLGLYFYYFERRFEPT